MKKKKYVCPEIEFFKFSEDIITESVGPEVGEGWGDNWGGGIEDSTTENPFG